MSDEEAAKRIKEAGSKDNASMPSLDDAFKSLGFDPENLGKERDGKAVKPKKLARPSTEKELADEGLSAASAAFPSPFAHFVFERVLAFLELMLFACAVALVCCVTLLTFMRGNKRKCNPVWFWLGICTLLSSSVAVKAVSPSVWPQCELCSLPNASLAAMPTKPPCFDPRQPRTGSPFGAPSRSSTSGSEVQREMDQRLSGPSLVPATNATHPNAAPVPMQGKPKGKGKGKRGDNSRQKGKGKSKGKTFYPGDDRARPFIRGRNGQPDQAAWQALRDRKSVV